MPSVGARQPERPPQQEVCASQRRVAPNLPLLEKARTQQQKPSAAKNKQIKFFKNYTAHNIGLRRFVESFEMIHLKNLFLFAITVCRNLEIIYTHKLVRQLLSSWFSKLM